MKACVRLDPVLFETSIVSVSRALAFGSLARQPQLPAPAKLVLCPDGKAGLLAEIHSMAGRGQGEVLAQQALEAAFSWLEGASMPAGGGELERVKPADLEQALSGSPYPWQPLDDGAYRLDLDLGGAPERMRVEACWPGALHVLSESVVALRGPVTLEALSHYALFANRRLRLARLSVAGGGDSAASIVWDTVVPAPLPLAPALLEAIDAVAAARALTSEALRALAEERVARTYLLLRDDGRPEITTRRSS